MAFQEMDKQAELSEAFRAREILHTSDQPYTEPRTITFVVGVNSVYFPDTIPDYSFIESHRFNGVPHRAQAPQWNSMACTVPGRHHSQAIHYFIRSRCLPLIIMGWIGSSDGEYNSATDTYEQWPHCRL
jgi:hypothetical protein